MAARNGRERPLVARFDKLNIKTKPPTGFTSQGKSSSAAFQAMQPRQFVPRPPARTKPTPPISPKKSTYFRKFYAVKTEDTYEQRISGDGEAFVDDDEDNKGINFKIPSFERLPPDGCFSDIAEEDEDADKKNNDFDDDEVEDALGDFGDEFCDDEMDEMEDDEGVCS